MEQVKRPKKPLMFYYTIVLIILILFNIIAMPYIKEKQIKDVDYGTFISMTEKKEIKKVELQQQDNTILFTGKDGKTIYKTAMVNDPDLTKRLYEADVSFYGEEIDQSSPILVNILSWVLPILFFVALGEYMSRKLMKRAGGKNAMSFGMGKSSAKIYVKSSEGIRFHDVAGEDEAKENLSEIVEYLHNPARYKEIGASMPKGILLVGPPGTGKTMLAKAVAGEANVPFFSMSGSEFVEMFVGMGASKVRDLFQQAKEKAPCIVFIDEIDAIGKKRDGQIGGNDEREQTLNQLLTEMDGFEDNTGVIILAATNRPEVLDKALLRPGRFDRRIIVDKPDLKGRLETLKVHSKDVHMDETVDLDALALATAGLVGSDLANMINEAAINAVKNGRKFVNQSDLFEAFELVAVGGKEKKDRVMSDKERKIVSYHEVGHALVSALQKNTEPVQKITIVPRTMGALGYTLQTPEEEKYLETKDELLAKITTFMAGRAAEVLVFHSATSGAANDIENATKIARAMVTMYGMSDTFGMMCLATVENQYLDGRAGLICGEDTAGQIDKEVLSIINKSYEDAMQMLTENRDILDHISDYLYEKETITGKEFMKIFREMKGLPQEEDKESLMPDDTADEKKASQEPRVLSKENNEAKDDTSIAEDSQSKAAIVSDDMFEE